MIKDLFIVADTWKNSSNAAQQFSGAHVSIAFRANDMLGHTGSNLAISLAMCHGVFEWAYILLTFLFDALLDWSLTFFWL